jgi:hypothetical protein
MNENDRALNHEEVIKSYRDFISNCRASIDQFLTREVNNDVTREEMIEIVIYEVIPIVNAFTYVLDMLSKFVDDIESAEKNSKEEREDV